MPLCPPGASWGFVKSCLRFPGALTVDAENVCFELDIAEERLMNSPGFDKRHWPDMSDAAWLQDIDTFYGIPPEAREETGNPA
jgi:hypothetical protein